MDSEERTIRDLREYCGDLDKSSGSQPGMALYFRGHLAMSADIFCLLQFGSKVLLTSSG